MVHADRKVTHHLTDEGVLTAYELVGTAISVMQMQLRMEVSDLRMTCLDSKLSAWVQNGATTWDLARQAD